mgnify:FL=1
MKKKILLTVFAVILVLATALTCTACNKKELKLKNDMSADELMVALVKADVKSITKVETTSNGMVSTTYFTQSGSTEIIERDGKVQRAEFKSFEDGKYFNFTKRDADSEWIKGAYTLGGNEVLKSSVDEFRSEFTDLLLNIRVGKNVRVENNDSIVIEKNDRTIVYKDINKTSLYVPAEIADYKSSALMEIGYYHIVDGGYGLSETSGNITFKSYRILSEIGDSPVVSACIYEDAQKIYIPKSVVKIELNGGASSVEIHYDGTVAEWNNNVTIIKNYLSADKIIKCSDGDATVVAPKKGE